MLFIITHQLGRVCIFIFKRNGSDTIPRKGQLTGYFIKCENCNKEIYQTKTQYNRAKNHFCSNKCQKEFQHTKLFEDRTCPICKNIFHVSKKSTQKFCSIQCQGKWQSTITGQLNPRTNRIKYKCDCCHKEISIIPSNYERFNHHFCNEICRQQWYSETFSQDENWKEISKLRATSILSERKIDTNTKPQIIINTLLDDMCIKYRNEENFKYYSVDNYLFEHNLIIEVMGDFWHCNPLKYTYENMRDIQKKRIPKDKAKHSYILKYHNIEILYLWENDIYKNIELCRELILKYINNNGILGNYNSFNYSIVNGELVKNKNLIVPFYELTTI